LPALILTAIWGHVPFVRFVGIFGVFGLSAVFYLTNAHVSANAGANGFNSRRE
jgi:hypothetical protein